MEGSFRHKVSSIRYRLYKTGGKAFFNYERLEPPAIQGSQQIDYFVGSGRRGRSYLFSIDGFLYQSPASYYSQTQLWDISPGYESYQEMPFSRAVEPSCLYCHASQVQHVEGTQNKYDSPPFAHGGVTCERCHGPGGRHVEGLAPMINPVRLSPERRDSVCAQCHLTGEARISQPGKNLGMFRPGDLLSDYVLSFVYEGKSLAAYKPISHVEAIGQSQCKLRSGDSMSCMSCHDPHSVPSPEERTSYFRQKCLTCHLEGNPSPELQTHFQRNIDCSGCHMPQTQALSTGHTTLTDHRILRRPSSKPQNNRAAGLLQFGASQSDERGLGLAYGELSLRNPEPLYVSEAMRLLKRVLPRYPEDPKVLTSLAYLYQTRGETDEAAALYQKALEADPHQIVAAVNLGAIYGARGQLQQALALWQRALASNPGLSEAGINAARVFWARGDTKRANDLLKEVLRLNPDSRAARDMLREMKRN